MKTTMRVEFTIDPEVLGRIVMMVEEVGATDFTFVTVKPVPKRGPGQPGHPPPRKQKAGRGGPSEAVIKLLRRQGTARKADVDKALLAIGASAKSSPALIWRMKRNGIIKSDRFGEYQLAKAKVDKTPNGAAVT
jgi:hypothetical protein